MNTDETRMKTWSGCSRHRRGRGPAARLRSSLPAACYPQKFIYVYLCSSVAHSPVIFMMRWRGSLAGSGRVGAAGGVALGQGLEQLAEPVLAAGDPLLGAFEPQDVGRVGVARLHGDHQRRELLPELGV